MTDRYFKNFMSDFVQEKATVPGIDEDKQEDSLLKLLALPYPTLSEKLKRAALDLKETIVVKTWGFTGQDIKDFSLYRGSLGTAFLLLKSYQVTNNKNDLDLASEIIKACDSSSSSSRVVSFLLGRAGVCALGAVVAKHQGNEEMVDYYLTQFKEIKLSEDVLDEVIFGRAGYLSACLFLNKNLGHETIPSSHTGVVIDKMIENGRKLGSKGKCPLMFEYKGERQWGVAHGLAGILNVLMHFELKSDVVLDVKETLKYMIKNRFPSGNYPKQEDMKSDLLVYWCHGASGVALTLVKAAEVFEDKEFLEAAIDASKVVWDRGLLKKVGICHGISGNAYVFLSLYKMTGSVEFLHKAKAFACFLLDKSHKLISEGEMHGGDNPYSLFEGIGGMAYLFLDMTDPTNAKFPTHEV
ncbi:lanC-like protein GCL2 [Lactuca sativa]|uniref:lanC-like protein GCL2 n=1 Tax=Lactuca sativa TaxID=4236 RepID=UPI000CA990BD|nr:lanC-like protein GCL2 [Lactuca sativa]